MAKVIPIGARSKRARAEKAQREAHAAAGLTEKQLLEFKIIALYQVVYALMLERDEPYDQVTFDMDVLQTLNPREVVIEKHPDPRVGTDGHQRAKIVISLVDTKPAV